MRSTICSAAGGQKPKLEGGFRVAVAGDRVPRKVSGDVILLRTQVLTLVLFFQII